MSDARQRARLVPLQPAAGTYSAASAVEIRRARLRRRKIFLCRGVKASGAQGSGADRAASDGAQRASRIAAMRARRVAQRNRDAQPGQRIQASAQGKVGRGMVAVKWQVALWLAASAEDTHAH